VWLTAAHCFADPAHAPAPVFLEGLFERRVRLVIMRLGDAREYECSVAFATPPLGDTAVLDCPSAPNGAALVRALVPRGVAVMAIGFVEDSFPPTTPYHIRGASVAVNVLPAHATNVAGPPLKRGSCTPAATELPELDWRVEPAGFFDLVVELGMSGGPLLDARGGVRGIIHGRACHTSVFVGLDAVDGFLAGRE
jgi:hypothetical protein